MFEDLNNIPGTVCYSSWASHSNYSSQTKISLKKLVLSTSQKLWGNKIFQKLPKICQTINQYSEQVFVDLTIIIITQLLTNKYMLSDAV